MRSDIVVVEGFKFGSRTEDALRQSRYSVESWLSQKARSAASLSNVGIGFGAPALTSAFLRALCAFAFGINLSLLPTHVPR